MLGELLGALARAEEAGHRHRGMFSQTKNSPSLPSFPRTVCGARSRNFLSMRSPHMFGGSTKCESPEIIRYAIFTDLPCWKRICWAKYKGPLAWKSNAPSHACLYPVQHYGETGRTV